MKNLSEAWVIRDERRKEKLPWDQLSKMSFSAGSQASGGILLGDGAGIRANAIALHTRAVQPDELPVIQPDEESVPRSHPDARGAAPPILWG